MELETSLSFYSFDLLECIQFAAIQLRDPPADSGWWGAMKMCKHLFAGMEHFENCLRCLTMLSLLEEGAY